MQRIWLVILLSFAWVSVSGQLPVTMPPRRVAFEAKASVDVTFGKLWWDIGLFHPFTGEVSRDQWEKGYFALMNQAVLQGADPAVLAAEALALLKDPASLLLESNEGQGDHFLPVLWEVKNGQAWIIGGDREQIAEPFGPVDTINGTPLTDFLAKRLGSFRSDDRMYVALTLASRQVNAFSVEYVSSQKKLNIRSVSKPEEVKAPWIRGGWKGTPIFNLDKQRFDTIADIKKKIPGGLDVRSSSWKAVSDSETIEALLITLGSQCPKSDMVRVVREHRGQYDEDWDRYAHDSASFNRIAAYPAPNRISWVQPSGGVRATLPQVILDPLLAEVLAGWALPASMNTCAKVTRYSYLPGLDVRLRLESWCGSLSDAKSQATYQNGAILNVNAAKSLAAATIINFDHLFAFTPESMQAGVFQAALNALKVSKNALDLVQRSGGITKDFHSPVLSAVPFKDALQRIVDPILSKPVYTVLSGPILPTFEMANGEVRIMRSIKGKIPAGWVVEKVNGIDLADLVKRIRPYTAARDENRDLTTLGRLEIGGELGKALTGPGVYSFPANLVVVDPKGAKKKITLEQPYVSDREYEPFSGAIPTGWKILNKPTVAELTHALATGEKVIVDGRKRRSLDLSKGWELPAPFASPSQGGFRRTPSSPVVWGTPSPNELWETQNDTTIALRGFAQPVSTNKNLPGSLVVVVSGETVSYPEIVVTFLKEAFPGNTRIIGLPTGGSMGSRCVLALPIGGDNALAFFSPTVSMDIINGKNYSYRGIPLDRQITESDLDLEMKAGSVDPLFSAVLKVVESH